MCTCASVCVEPKDKQNCRQHNTKINKNATRREKTKKRYEIECEEENARKNLSRESRVSLAATLHECVCVCVRVWKAARRHRMSERAAVVLAAQGWCRAARGAREGTARGNAHSRYAWVIALLHAHSTLTGTHIDTHSHTHTHSYFVYADAARYEAR